MADELTSNVAPDPPSESPAQGQPTEQAEPRAAEPQSQAVAGSKPTSEPKSKDKSGVNLFELPEFRQYQSTLTRQQQQREQEYQRKLAEYEQRMQQLEEANLDDYEKAQRRAERAENELNKFRTQMTQQQQQEEANRKILEDMQRISTKTGIPIERLFTAQSYDEAWEMGLAHLKEQSTVLQKAEEERLEANRTVVGGGKASTPTDRTAKVQNEYLSKKDGKGYIHSILYGG